MSFGIAERYRAVAERVTEAALRAGRRPQDVTVVAAAKTFAADRVAEAIAGGARDVGENYVQEAMRKGAALAGAEAPVVRWHLIGRLQRNKAKQAAGLFHLIHSLDSVELARALDRAAIAAARDVRCLVEVNVGGELTKGGVAPERLEGLLGAIASLARVSVHGLMAIPPPAARAEQSQRFFARLREIRDGCARLRLRGVELKELSMGMSADFEVAIAEGATIVRIGTAIFGPRSGGA